MSTIGVLILSAEYHGFAQNNTAPGVQFGVQMGAEGPSCQEGRGVEGKAARFPFDTSHEMLYDAAH